MKIKRSMILVLLELLSQTRARQEFPCKSSLTAITAIKCGNRRVSTAKKARDLPSRPSYRLRVLYIYFTNIIAWILSSLSATPSSRIDEVKFTLASFGRVVEMNSDSGGGERTNG